MRFLVFWGARRLLPFQRGLYEWVRFQNQYGIIFPF